MTELSGTLEGVGLPAIVRLLTGLGKTGCLRIVHGDWQGDIVFEAGRLVDASLGSRRGLAALDGLVEALSAGSFTFYTSSRATSAPTIDLSREALQVHLDEVAARVANGSPDLPSVDAVPELLAPEASGAGEDPLPLDRGMLQTLLAVDGQRTVREIVAHRGSLDALWQLGDLAGVGLVRMASASAAVQADARTGQPTSLNAAAQTEPATGHCPKLGFEDDAGNSFDRPTRLHRCFASGTPLPLSVDQQRELCLSDQFGTCPRLNTLAQGATRAPARDFRRAPSAINAAGNAALGRAAAAGAARAIGVAARSDALPTQPEADDPRIVRLPFRGRRNAAQRGGGGGDRQAVNSAEPTQLRSTGGAAIRGADSPRPTPLHARIDGAVVAASAPAVAQSGAVATRERRPPEQSPLRGVLDNQPLRRVGGIPVPLIAVGALVLVAVTVIVYLLAPHVGKLFVDDTLDASTLPNASAAAAGTPVKEITGRMTPAPRAPAGVTNGSAANAAVPTAILVSEATAATSADSTAPSMSQAPASSVASDAAAGTTMLLDQSFANNAGNWPSNVEGTAWWSSGSYRLLPRQAGQFVAVGAPLPEPLKDVVVSATFRKLNGTPAGGGFGIILRDQSASALDGTNQDGRYYVLEVGDKGEVGIWRRDVDHWVDLLPWQHSDAVHAGTATNEMIASAIGNRLTLSVNGTQITSRTDDTFPTGRVGLLSGGDGNQVAVEHVSIQTR